MDLPAMFSRIRLYGNIQRDMRGVHQVLGKWHDIEMRLTFSGFQPTARTDHYGVRL